MNNRIDENISLSPYNKQWPLLFEQEKGKLLTVFREYDVHIEHFGSTSIKGMTAKPVIDILVGLPEIHIPKGTTSKLRSAGYEDLGEAGIPGRIYYRKRGAHNFNLAVTVFESRLWENNLLIRDFLRSNREYQIRYSRLKSDALQSGRNTLLAYSRYKEDFMKELLQKAIEYHHKNLMD